MQTVMALPDKYKTVVYLYYYEGYSSAEIAGMLGRPQSTIRNYMTEARRLLKERSGEDFDEER
jgi:RNA polymerase sigma-70 factor (ECF subfamily)